MKRTIALLTLSLAFSLSSNAQEEKKVVPSEQLNISEDRTPEVVEKEIKSNLTIEKDIDELKNSVKMDEGFAKEVSSLLFKRSEALKATNNIDEKKKVFNIYTQKFLTRFSSDQIDMLKKNKELFIRLTEYSSK